MIEIKAESTRVYALIEEHWRAIFESNCISNEQIDQHDARLRQKLQKYCESLPEAEQWKVIEWAQAISNEFSDECERDARSMRRRLCGSKYDRPVTTTPRSTVVNSVVDTAVRATVWQLVASLFRR